MKPVPPACNLARLTHAPDVTLIYESGTIGTKPDVLPLSIGDGELCDTAVTTVAVPEMFRYWLQGGRISVGFLGAAQLDRFGNLNTTVVGDDYHHPKVRLPGGGAPEIATSCGEIFIVMKQSKRGFVDNIDFMTSLGHGKTGREREALGIKTKGPSRLTTDLCIMETDPATREFIVTSIHPGVTTEQIRDNTGWAVRRADQDAFALRSQQRAARAQAAGIFAQEIVPVSIPQRRKDPILFAEDEHPRPDTTADILARLGTPFRQNGSVTAGNASGVNDGAAALIIASEDAVKKYGLTPIAKVIGGATAGVEPRIMGFGPAPASQKLCQKLGMTIDQFDVIELNEAFASQALATLRDLGLADDAEQEIHPVRLFINPEKDTMIQVSPFDSGLYQSLLSDSEAGAWLNDQAQLKAMLEVEGELAQAQAEAGLIPADAGAAIATAAASLTPDPASLADGTASAGVPIPALVKALKEALPANQARWVHFGATSQDIVDTALMLNCRELIGLYEVRIRAMIAGLADLAHRHRDTLMAGRTRTQQAVPMSFGFKAAQWLAPLVRQLERLEELKPRLLKTQLGGAVGTLAAMGDKADLTGQILARRLGLACGNNWHTQRDSLVEFSGWLSLCTGALGKIAQDWLLMSQTEVGEIRFSNGGGSSTMPQKCNPVNAEIILAMARQNAGLVGQMYQAMLHEHERSGSSWAQEWLVLPQQLMATAVALKHGLEALQYLEVNGERMLQNLGAFNGVIYAEAATFELARSMPRDQAASILKQACHQAIQGPQHLFDIVAQLSGTRLDIAQMQQRLLTDGATTAWLDAVLQQARTLTQP
jgi:3-carboxy-cis,cis-muconate cycloisomerase